MEAKILESLKNWSGHGLSNRTGSAGPNTYHKQHCLDASPNSNIPTFSELGLHELEHWLNFVTFKRPCHDTLWHSPSGASNWVV